MRNRSITIYAENEDEYLKALDSQVAPMRRSRLSRLTFDDDDDDKPELEEMKEVKKSYFIDEDDEYSGLGVSDIITGDEASEEEKLINQYHCRDSLNAPNSYEKNIDLLCLYLKNSITSMTTKSQKQDGTPIFYKNKNCLHTLSGNAIYDVNVRELVENFISNSNDENINMNENVPNGFNDLINRNLGSDTTLKILLISNNPSLKYALTNQFMGNNICQNESEKLSKDLPFEIKKKIIKQFNKNISLELFDTSSNFFNQPTSSVYYKLSNAFLFLIDGSCKGSSKFVNSIYQTIGKNSINKTIVLIAFNMLFKEDCTLDGENLRDLANEKGMLYFSCQVRDFDINNKKIKNLLSLILIKKMDLKMNKTSEKQLNMKLTNSKISSNMGENKIKIQNCLGYKKQYRIKNFDIFDFSDDDLYSKRKLKRTWSMFI